MHPPRPPGSPSPSARIPLPSPDEVRLRAPLADPVERVWTALTDPDRIVEWLAEAELELVEGGRVELRWLNTDEEGNSAVARGTVSKLEPPRVLELDTDIHGILRWVLDPADGGCRLTFTANLQAPDDWPNWPMDRWRFLHDHYERTPA